MLQPGENIDIWVVEKQLGSGGMGSVYRCHNRNASRILAAVKTLDTSLRKVPGAEERFIREAEILFRIDHPNIVKVRNVRTDTEQPYLEMEFVEGESLESLLEQGPVPLPLALSLAEQLADAIGYLHGQGIRHRDIKPANLLVKSGTILKLVDFGLAMEADVTRITQAGMSFGTVSYAPPEWAFPDIIDPMKWDIYAMGVVFWEMLTGGVAFPVSGVGNPRQQAMQVMLQKQNHEPLDPGPAFQEPLRALVRDLTCADMHGRPATANIVLERLRGLERSYNRPSGQTLLPESDWVPSAETLAPAFADLPAALRQPSDGLVSDPRSVRPVRPREVRDTWQEAEKTPPPAPTSHPPDATPTLVLPNSATIPVSRVETTGASRRWPWVVVLVGLVGSFGLIAVTAVAAAVIWQNQPTERDVDLVVSGVSTDLPVTLTIDGTTPSRHDDFVFTFRDVTFGQASIVAVVGADCGDTCLTGSCAEWCHVQTATAAVSEGTGIQTIPVSLDPPALRPLTLQAADVESPILTVNGRTVTELLPGRYEGSLSANGLTWNEPITVPWGVGAVVVPLHPPAAAIPVPPPVVDDPSTVKTTVDPTKNPIDTTKTAILEVPVKVADVATTATGKPVINRDFAKWLAKNPEYQKDAAVAANLADASYLSGWNANEPPAGHESDAAVYVSWYIAQAYCRSKGGDLPMTDAEPATWAESATQPGLEWRRNGTKAQYRGSDGMEGNIGRTQTTAITGFRCAK